MSKSSRRNKAARKLASKMGLYLQNSSVSKKGTSGFNKPGTKQIKGKKTKV